MSRPDSVLVRAARRRYQPTNRSKCGSLDGPEDGASTGLKTSSQLLEIFDDLAHHGAEACLVIEQLTYRSSVAAARPAYQGPRLPVTTLHPFYPAYAGMCAAIDKVAEACGLYLHCCGLLDSAPKMFVAVLDPQARFADFIARCGELSPHFDKALESWKVTERLEGDLRRILEARMPWGWEWICRAGRALSLDWNTTRLINIIEDLPRIIGEGKYHLSLLERSCAALAVAVTQIESVRLAKELTETTKHDAEAIHKQIFTLRDVFFDLDDSMDYFRRYCSMYS